MPSMRFLTATILLVVLSGHSAPVDLLSAAAVAETHSLFARKDDSFSRSDFLVRAIEEIKDIETSDVLAYAAVLHPTGYVIVPNETRLRPVIAYSFDSPFIIADSPENAPLKIVRADIKNRIAAIPFTKKSILSRNEELWRDYLDASPRLLSILTDTDDWGPYVDTRWNQGAPYNTYCPIDPETGELCPIGCVVTAMGQIVNYWEWPPSIAFADSESYYSEATTPPIYIDAPAASVDTIDYNGEGFQPTDDTKARLLYACGVAILMQYKDGGSAASSERVATALRRTFRYNSADLIYPSSPNFYTDILLDVINGGTSHLSVYSEEAGHAIVIDGYKSSGEFHANYGWGGAADGWYFLPDSLPYGFTTATLGIVNIVPPVITHRPVATIRAETHICAGVSIFWDAPSLITEPVLRYNVYRREIPDTIYTFLRHTTSRRYDEIAPKELSNFSYAVSAVYTTLESPIREVSLISGIYNGWAKILYRIGDQIPTAIAAADGGGFIAAGYNTPISGGGNKAYLVRVSSIGGIVWERNYGEGPLDAARAIVRSGANEYLIAGETGDGGSGTTDAWLGTIDTTGDTLWTRTYGGPGNDAFHSAAATADGGFILVGTTMQGSELRSRAMKVDSEGDSVWARLLPVGFSARSVIENSENDILVAGSSTSGPLGGTDAFVSRFSAAGDSMWTSFFGGTNSDEAYSLAPSDDGGAVAACISRSFGPALFTGIFIFKTDSDGNEVWSRAISASRNYTAYSITPLPDGGFAALGSAALSGNTDMFVVFLDSLGDTTRTHSYGAPGTDIGYAILCLPDSALAIAGKTFDFASGNDYWLIEVGGPLASNIEDKIVSKPKVMDIAVFPNPFNSSLSILAPMGSELEIYDIKGRRVRYFGSGVESNGKSLFLWIPDASLPSGIYFVRARVGESVAVKRTILLK